MSPSDLRIELCSSDYYIVVKNLLFLAAAAGGVVCGSSRGFCQANCHLTQIHTGARGSSVYSAVCRVTPGALRASDQTHWASDTNYLSINDPCWVENNQEPACQHPTSHL